MNFDLIQGDIEKECGKLQADYWKTKSQNLSMIDSVIFMLYSKIVELEKKIEALEGSPVTDETK